MFLKFFFLLPVLFLFYCIDNPINAQQSVDKGVGGRCEGCEAIYENTVPFEKLGSELRLPGYHSDGPKLEISGRVLKPDGKTPAPGVILYLYHTDRKGVYPKNGREEGWAKRHGYIRGWLKTNDKGEYLIKTIRPASYPNSSIAAHIHCFVKEPSINEYYIHDFLFEDDPLLTDDEKNTRDKPGGNGVLQLHTNAGVSKATRDIYLGKNIENYPR